MFTLIYCLVFLFLAVVRVKYSKMLLGLLSCVFKKSYFIDFSNELQDSFSGFKGLLFLIQNLILSVFFYLLTIRYLDTTVANDYGLYLKIFFTLTLFLIFQYSFSVVISKVFSFTDLFKQIHVLKFSYLKIVTFLMLPFLLIETYSGLNISSEISNITIIVFVVLMLLRSVIVVFRNNKLIIESLFYFIVYLCTLEIIPVLLILKVAVNK